MMTDDADGPTHPTVRLATFVIPLPEPLALPHDMTVGFEGAGESLLSADDPPLRVTKEVFSSPGWKLTPTSVSLRLWQQKSAMVTLREQLMIGGQILRHITGQGSPQPEAPPEDIFAAPMTVVEAVTPLADGEALDTAFDRCLDRINHLAVAYGLAGKQAVAPITLPRLPMFVLVAIRWGDSFEFDTVQLFGLHERYIQRHLPPLLEDQSRLRGFMSEVQQGGPVIAYMQLSAEARRFFDHDGDTRTAVIMAATACEVLLDGLLAVLLWEEGRDSAALRTILQDPITTRVKRHYSSRLGGNWQLDRPGPLARWHTDLASLRNRCVHAGYTPSYEEALTASRAESALLTFIKQRLTRNRRKYPRAELLFGLPNAPGDRPQVLNEFVRWRESSISSSQD